MTGERVLPGLGMIRGFYTPGTSGWAGTGQVDTNWLGLSALAQIVVESRTAALPGSPTDGVIYIIPSGGDADKIAVRDNGAWVNLTPQVGWIAYVKDDEEFVFYNTANDWEVMETGGGGSVTLAGLSDVDFAIAPLEGQALIRQGAVWVAKNLPAIGEVITFSGTAHTFELEHAYDWCRTSNGSAVAMTVPPNADVPYAIGTILTLEQAGAGLYTWTEGAGVTINPQPGLTLVSKGQFAVSQAKKVSTNLWTAYGALEAA